MLIVKQMEGSQKGCYLQTFDCLLQRNQTMKPCNDLMVHLLLPAEDKCELGRANFKPRSAQTENVYPVWMKLDSACVFYTE